MWRRIQPGLIVVIVIAAFLIGRFSFQADPANPASESASPFPTVSPTLSSLSREEFVTQRSFVQRVIDGDTIEVGDGSRVRLIGIDAPETGNCGASEAKSSLRSLIEGESVELEKDISETDRYGRLLRYLWLDDILVNELLVKEGFAHSSTFPPDVNYQDRFLAAEKEARDANRGLWSSCQAIKGAMANDSDSCIIKGNISSKGEKIYHLPGQRYYEKTQIDESKGEKWFCSEEEANSAGWRKSKV